MRLGIYANWIWVIVIFLGVPSVCPSSILVGQTRDSLLPKQLEYDGSIQSPREFFGFEIGQRHLRHDQLVAYFQNLAQQSDRVQVHNYGFSHDGRPLLLMIASAAERMDYLGVIQQQHRLLTKPDRSSDVDRSDLPVVVNMGYGVHGDEPSASNVAALVAYWLAAGQSAEIDEILQNCVILLDPCLNPDGFDRFANWQATYRGRQWNPDPNHAEHRQGWPSGRTNYYWFDLNRDWLPLQHPESRARAKWFHLWKPNVVLDYHEMGTRATYFFQPGVPQRANPLIPRRNIELTEMFGNYHAKALDSQRSLYYTEEGFDDFYPGKGSTYPDLHGGVGILFEQASSRGQVQENQHGLLNFSKTIANQLTTSISSLRAATENRQSLLEYQVEFYEEAWLEAAQADVQTYVFSALGNRSRLQELADLFLRHDIECYWLNDNQPIGDHILDSRYSLIVPTLQAESKFLQALVEQRTEFMENEFYDISAWSAPLAFGVTQQALAVKVPSERLIAAKLGQRQSVAAVAKDGSVKQTAASDNAEQSAPEISQKPVAFAIDWRDDSQTAVLVKLLKEQIHVEVAQRPFSAVVSADGDESKTLDDFGRGTLVVPMAVQKKPLPTLEKLLQTLQRGGGQIKPIFEGLTPNGPDLGSRHFSPVTLPNVALLVGQGVSAYQAGEVWHHFDTRLQMKLSLIQPAQWITTDWDRYQTIIVVSGSYSATNVGFESLTQWVRRGGNLIVIGSAVESVGRGVLGRDVVVVNAANSGSTNTGAANGGVQSPNLATDSASKTDANLKRPEFDPARDTAVLRQISGAIFSTEVDLTHPLLYGVNSSQMPVFRTGTILLQMARPETQNPLVYGELLAGYASAENQQRLRGTPSVAVHQAGEGRVILFADDPLFRAYWLGTTKLFNNALFFAPQMTSRSGGGEGNVVDNDDDDDEVDD